MSAIAVKPSATGTATVEIAAPITNTPITYDLPKHGGKVAAFGAPAAKTATGTAVDFINGSGDVVIPNDARRITVMLNGVSIQESEIDLQIGSGSIQTSGYESSVFSYNSGVDRRPTNAFALTDGVASAALISGHVTLVRAEGNAWVQSAVLRVPAVSPSAGRVTLSGALDRIRLTTQNGTDTFDAGTVAILVE